MVRAAIGILLLLATPAFASVSVKRSANAKTLDVAIVDEPLSSAVKALGPYLPHRVQFVVSEEPTVTYKAAHVSAEAALRGVAGAAGAMLTLEHNQFWIRKDHDATVTLDVKDEDVRVILKSMKQQCGVKNVILDPDVQGKGTFLFNKVPCRTAFSVVFRTMGLWGSGL
jgi:hypothetical protein